jgi:hypothetical protein
MLLRLKKWLAARLHRVLGITAIRDDVATAAADHTRQLLPLFNGLRYAAEPLDAVRARPEYQRCAAAVALLAPRLIDNAELVRIGGPNDGGYVMLASVAPPVVTAAYSFGVGGDVSWDRAIAERGVDVFLYDHTVRQPPRLPARCRFQALGITGARSDARLRTLRECLAANGHTSRDDLVLKMDVEGAEWDVLAEVASQTLDQFHQIAIEFHDLAGVLDPSRHDAIIAALVKLAATHQPVHVHANCMHLPIWIGDLVLPPVLEVTYVRRRDVIGRIGDLAGPFPRAIDQPNMPGWPDVYLGWFGGVRPG